MHERARKFKSWLLSSRCSSSSASSSAAFELLPRVDKRKDSTVPSDEALIHSTWGACVVLSALLLRAVNDFRCFDLQSLCVTKICL